VRSWTGSETTPIRCRRPRAFDSVDTHLPPDRLLLHVAICCWRTPHGTGSHILPFARTPTEQHWSHLIARVTTLLSSGRTEVLRPRFHQAEQHLFFDPVVIWSGKVCLTTPLAGGSNNTSLTALLLQVARATAVTLNGGTTYL